MKFFKVLKYEFLENMTPILLINGILIVLILTIRLFVGAVDSYYDLNWFASMLIMLTPFMIFCSIIFLVIVILKSLNSRLFSTEGYLTLSLPVKLDSILVSKIIVSASYILLSLLVVFLWVFLMIGSIEIDVFRKAYETLRSLDFLHIIYILWLTILYTIKPLICILFILTLLNIGKINRFKPLVGIVLFFVLYIMESLTFGIAKNMIYHSFLFIDGYYADFIRLFFQSHYKSINIFVLTESISTIAIILIYYFFSKYLIKNKLEI